MRILILSDLHHELWRERALKINSDSIRPDVVILAGDINTGAKAVKWAERNFDGVPVMYVHGNHEGYGQNLDSVQEEIETACDSTKNVHFLNCAEHIIENVRFLGATMWTDFKLFGEEERQSSMREAEGYMNDYKRIRLARKGYRKLRASDTAQFHTMQRSWLSQKLQEVFLGKTVVITHMAPSIRSVEAPPFSDRLPAAYASHLDQLVEQADIWVHGHVHESLDYRIGKCRVICNPCGYINKGGESENGNFDPNFHIEI